LEAGPYGSIRLQGWSKIIWLNQWGKPITVPLNPPLKSAIEICLEKSAQNSVRTGTLSFSKRHSCAISRPKTAWLPKWRLWNEGFLPGVVLSVSIRESPMSNIKTLAIASALLIGASSLAPAMAQSTQNNSAASGGPGTHQGAIKSGSAENNQKVEKNQNGYAPGRQ
jgi:hypothetical protein